ncbi:Bgt-51689 [Blumeria graminis f. sp. tritici]|uniref:Bgt-51689 n=1 Tax=Blumeria graminis f. sp. tritici TaxID=62690 RepID=A0A9X9QBH3_BLUGR|nr:Bgt-51689 [Blumeria graminis f. sp. tritici]
MQNSVCQTQKYEEIPKSCTKLDRRLFNLC